MTPEQKLTIVVSILIINSLIAIGYFIYGCIATRNNGSLLKYTIWAIFMFLCPVIGVLFLSIGNLCYRIFYDTSIDLAAITFSKDRVDVLEHPDIESEINLVPMEEAIMMDDKDSLRQLLLTVLRGDMSKSINAVTKALNSSDSEASHYAASAIMDIMNEFQNTIQKFQAQIESNPDDAEVIQLFIEYLIKMLRTDFLSDLELKTYVYLLMHVCEDLYEKEKSSVKVFYETNLIHLLVQIGDLQNAQLWIEHLLEDYPDNLEMYRCVLHYYYSTKDKDKFFMHLNNLKQSDITIDKDLLELIRVFS